MKQPTPAEVKEFLHLHGSPRPEVDGEIRTWEISGHLYDHPRAMEISELCLLTGQPLSAINTAALFLNMAQRITELEGKLTAAESADSRTRRSGR